MHCEKPSAVRERLVNLQVMDQFVDPIHTLILDDHMGSRLHQIRHQAPRGRRLCCVDDGG